MLKVKLEPAEITREFSGFTEDCNFCRAPTRHWHLESNTPVCEACAKTHSKGDLPPRALERMAERKLAKTVKARLKSSAKPIEVSLSGL